MYLAHNNVANAIDDAEAYGPRGMLNECLLSTVRSRIVVSKAGRMESNAWYREPLGDYVEAFMMDYSETAAKKGFARGLTNWHRLLELLLSTDSNEKFKSGMSSSQYHSFQILHEWWTGKTQEDFLSTAARCALDDASSPQNAKSDYLDVDRGSARLTESRYHREMFMLFQLEFVYEMRMMQTKEFGTFVGFVQAQRERCAQYAALQRVAQSFMEFDLNKDQAQDRTGNDSAQVSDSAHSSKLKSSVIPSCIESCPWLKVRDKHQYRPFYLWDVAAKRTVETQTLESCPPYTCVSHTWGRWRKVKENAVSIGGVPWLVPQNSKFVVAQLPEELLSAFGTGYVWFDLLCIPQDRCERALIEISRQAAIFSNASSVVTWLNDALTWNGLRTVAKWLSFFYLHTSVAVEHGRYNVPEMNEDDSAFFDDAIELYLWDPEDFPDKTIPIQDDEEIVAPVPWFTSLWTLQEACLRPDMILCNRTWEPFETGLGLLIPLDHLVALNNYLARGTYKKGVPEDELKLGVGGHADTTPPPPTRHGNESFDASLVEPEEIVGCKDLSTLLTDTCMSDLNWISPAAVFTFGQLRKCTKSRAEAIMSVIGATDWYTSYLSEHGAAPPEERLVLGYYPAAFLNEALSQIGPTFFTAIHTDLRYISGAVYLDDGDNSKWTLVEERLPVGSMLPFTASPTYLVPPQKYAFGEYNHPAVESWVISDDGSVHMTHVGLIDIQHLEDEGNDQEDMIIVPIPDEDGLMTSNSEIETIDGSLKEWLGSFSDPERAPNYAVCLYQQVYLNKDIPGPQVGLLLKKVGVIDEQLLLVKVGQYFTKSLSAWDVETKQVDRVVL